MREKQTYRVLTPDNFYDITGTSHSTTAGELVVTDEGNDVARFAAGMWTGVLVIPATTGEPQP